MDDVVLTFDVDWAPPFAIDFVAERLAASSVRSTWLITDDNPAVQSLRSAPELFELGIHPDFIPDSSRGFDPVGVLQHCMELVPEATTMRSHGLLLSSRLLIDTLTSTPIRTDLTLLLSRTPALQPCDFWWEGQRMVRVPTFWEDDLEFHEPAPSFEFSDLAGQQPGLKVLTFHPLHVYLNSSSVEPYRELRARTGDVRNLAERDIGDLVCQGRGTRTLLDAAIETLAGTTTRTASDVKLDWVGQQAV